MEILEPVEVILKIGEVQYNLGEYSRYSVEKGNGLSSVPVTEWVEHEYNGRERLTLKAWNGVEKYEDPLDFDDTGAYTKLGRRRCKHCQSIID